MKKVSFFSLVLLLGIIVSGFSQTTTPIDFYAGKWEIIITGFPRGEVKYRTNLIRKDGKLTGELVDWADVKQKRPITKVEERDNKLVIYYNSSQAAEIPIDLTKVDNDNLKGTLMDYKTRAKRLK